MKNTNVLATFNRILETPQLPSIGPERRSQASVSSLAAQLEAAFTNAAVSNDQKSLIRSLVLLWHDHLDESHTISQEIHTTDGSFLHGIMHRREPDYWNSKYWFNRVGKHPAYPEIALRVENLAKANSSTRLKVIANGQWNPDAFVDVCEDAAKGKFTDVSLLEQIQEIEFHVLLERFCQ